MESGANISPCGQYRTRLWRVWALGLPWLCFVMLNPSTADASINDATIAWCIAYAKMLGFGGIEVVNLYTLRTKSPAVLKARGYPQGEYADLMLRAAAANARSEGGKVVCAWGTNAQPHRAEAVRLMLAQQGVPVYHLGLNKDGSPKHPLYLPRKTPLTEWEYLA